MNEYEHYKAMAERKGWAMPRISRTWDQAWLNYWKACEEYEQDPSGGRPVRPHRSGGAGHA